MRRAKWEVLGRASAEFHLHVDNYEASMMTLRAGDPTCPDGSTIPDTKWMLPALSKTIRSAQFPFEALADEMRQLVPVGFTEGSRTACPSHVGVVRFTRVPTLSFTGPLVTADRETAAVPRVESISREVQRCSTFDAD